MCGIVGHIGPQNAVELVLEGLKRLEYRGYDSAGICYKNEKGNLELYKKAGRLDNLKATLKDKNCYSNSCIGHTRWATHGEVNDVNAHPHMSDTDTMAIDDTNAIAIVHNGIIENATELKQMLQLEGMTFRSQTDSEVFLGLMVYEMKKGAEFLQAFTNSFKRIRGNSAFVALNRGRDEILAIKRGAPLVCGTNDVNSDVLVSSDPYALAGVVNELFFPQDEVVCILSPAKENLLQLTELDGTATNRYLQKPQELSVDAADKGHFEHFMLKEIYEQPGLIRFLSQYYFEGDGKKTLDEVAKLKPEFFHIIGCGTAWHAGLVIKNFIEKNNRIPCAIELASEFRYREPLLNKKNVGLFISQSGETADTLAAQALCKENGLKTVSIVNVEGSTLFRDCTYNMLIRAGVEIGVASTKAFTQQVLTGHLLSMALKGNLDKKAITAKYSLLAERVDALLSDVDLIQKVAELTYNYKGFIFTARGQYFPIAFEGALKLKEIAYVHAEGYAAGELKHGPIALIDEQMVNIAIVGPELYEKTISNIQEVRARRGLVIGVGPRGDRDLEELSDFYIPLNFEGLDELSPVYVNVATQLLAYYMAKFKGTDIDKPRNLAKSVTVE